MQEQLISVIMPAYNEERFIGETIESIQKQTYSNWELVIVDDASKDRTVEIIKQYAQVDTRIKLHRFSVNKGACAALNKALTEAKGKYICWLSADDKYREEMLESSCRFLETHRQMRAVFSIHEFINEKSEVINHWKPGKEYGEIGSPGNTEPYRTLFLAGNAFNACTVMAEREAFQETGGFNTAHPYAGDYDFMLRLAACSDIGFLEKVNVQSRIHQGQVTNKGRNDLDAIHVFEELLYSDNIRRKLMYKAGFRDSRSEIVVAFANRMQIYEGLKKDEEVLELRKALQRFIREFPLITEADGYCNRITQCMDAGQWDRAGKMFQAMPQKVKDYADIEKLGIIAASIWEHDEEYEKERETLKKVLEYNEKNYEAHYMMGLIYERESNIFAALDSYVLAYKNSLESEEDFRELSDNLKRFVKENI